MSLHLKIFSVLILFISLLSAQEQDSKYYEEGAILYDKLLKAVSGIESVTGENKEELDKNLKVVIDITVNNKLRQAIDSGFNSDLNDKFKLLLYMLSQTSSKISQSKFYKNEEYHDLISDFYYQAIVQVSPRLNANFFNLTRYDYFSFVNQSADIPDLNMGYTNVLVGIWNNFYLNISSTQEGIENESKTREVIFEDIEYIYDYQKKLDIDEYLETVKMHDNEALNSFRYGHFNHYSDFVTSFIDTNNYFLKNDLKISDLKIFEIMYFYVNTAIILSNDQKYYAEIHKKFNLKKASSGIPQVDVYLQKNIFILEFLNDVNIDVTQMGPDNFSKLVSVWNEFDVKYIIDNYKSLKFAQNYIEVSLKSFFHEYYMMDLNNIVFSYQHIYPNKFIEIVNHNLILEEFGFYYEKDRAIYHDYVDSKKDFLQLLNDEIKGKDSNLSDLHTLPFFQRPLSDDSKWTLGDAFMINYDKFKEDEKLFEKYINYNVKTEIPKISFWNDYFKIKASEGVDFQYTEKVLTEKLSQFFSNLKWSELTNNPNLYYNEIASLKLLLLISNSGKFFNIDSSFTHPEDDVAKELQKSSSLTVKLSEDPTLFKLLFLELNSLNLISNLYPSDNAYNVYDYLTSWKDLNIVDYLDLIKSQYDYQYIIYNTALELSESGDGNSTINEIFSNISFQYVINLDKNDISITKTLKVFEKHDLSLNIIDDINVMLKLIESENDLSEEYLKKFYNLLVPENINFADFPLIHIIKDPVFYYVPNEALIDADNKYLIQKSLISKNLNLLKVLGVTEPIKDFDSDFELVFFGNIDYEKSPFDLVNLPASEFELNHLKDISEKNELKFFEFSKSKASKENFVNVKSGDLFYLSMHSISDKINFYDSQMYFNDDFLTIKDMLDFNFEDVSLFYLSGCETDASIKIPNVLPVTLSSLISNYGSKGVVGTKKSIEDTVAFINGALFTKHYIESGLISIALYRTLNEFINVNDKISKPKYWTNFSYYGF